MFVPSIFLALATLGVCSEIDRASLAEPPWRILPDESVFAVVTEKAGFAARLAHNHLIVARDYRATLDFDPDRPGATTFEFEAGVADLVIDDEAERARWEPGILALGLTPELGRPGEEDRTKIAREMLAEGQLDVESHPTLSARLVSVRAEGTTIESGEFSHVADIEVRIHGQTVQRAVAVRFEIDETDGGRVTIEVVGRFTFEEFGIKPYSAFMGSVKNKNEFHIYINMKAAR